MTEEIVTVTEFHDDNYNNANEQSYGFQNKQPPFYSNAPSTAYGQPPPAYG